MKRSTTSKKTKNGDPEGGNSQDEVCAEVENFEETKMEGSVKFSAYKWLADYFGDWELFLFSPRPPSLFMESHCLRAFGSDTGWTLDLQGVSLPGFIE